MRAICPAGPPKLSKPILAHTRRASRNGTRGAAGGVVVSAIAANGSPKKGGVSLQTNAASGINPNDRLLTNLRGLLHQRGVRVIAVQRPGEQTSEPQAVDVRGVAA